MWENLKNEKFDPLALWETVGQDMALLSEVVQIFSAEYPEMLHNIEEAVKQGDPAGLRKASHKLKGSLLQFAAPKAVAAAADLENSATTTATKNLGPLVDTVRAEVDSLVRLLDAMVANT